MLYSVKYTDDREVVAAGATPNEALVAAALHTGRPFEDIDRIAEHNEGGARVYDALDGWAKPRYVAEADAGELLLNADTGELVEGTKDDGKGPPIAGAGGTTIGEIGEGTAGGGGGSVVEGEQLADGDSADESIEAGESQELIDAARKASRETKKRR